MMEAFWEWLFGAKRGPLGDKLRRIVAADHLNERRGTPEPAPVFEGWRYLDAARRAA